MRWVRCLPTSETKTQNLRFCLRLRKHMSHPCGGSVPLRPTCKTDSQWLACNIFEHNTVLFKERLSSCFDLLLAFSAAGQHQTTKQLPSHVAGFHCRYSSTRRRDFDSRVPGVLTFESLLDCRREVKSEARMSIELQPSVDLVRGRPVCGLAKRYLLPCSSISFTAIKMRAAAAVKAQCASVSPILTWRLGCLDTTSAALAAPL